MMIFSTFVPLAFQTVEDDINRPDDNSSKHGASNSFNESQGSSHVESYFATICKC